MKKGALLCLAILVGPFCWDSSRAQTLSPRIFPGGIVNAASFAAAPNNPSSPCALVSIFGENLAIATGSATAVPLPRDINSTQVLVNNIAAPLIYVSPSQINAQVPCEAIPGSTARVVVQVTGIASPPEPLRVEVAAPGVFTVTATGTGAAAMLHANFLLVSNNSPAMPGETILIFCTGLGETVSPRPGTGEPGNGQVTLLTPTVLIGGRNAQVLFSGAAPGFVGLYQINAVVPSVTAGDQSLAISSGGRQSREGATVRIGSAPPTTATLFAATLYGGLFKRLEGDAAWSSINSGMPGVLTFGAVLAVDPSNPATVYVGTDGDGVYKTTDSGGRWTPANSGISNRSVGALGIDPANPATVYAGTRQAGIFKTTNGGANWGPVNSGLAPIIEAQGTVTAIAVDPRSPSVIYTGTAAHGVYKSTTGGASWNPINSGLTPNPLGDIHINTIATDPTNTATLYAGLRPFVTGGGAFKSSNGGASWIPINIGLRESRVTVLAIDPANPSTVYAGTYEGGIYKTTSGGARWTASGLDGAAVTALAIDPSNPTTVYAGTQQGVYRSTNGGASWTAFSAGLADTWITALAIARSSAGGP